MENFNFRFYTRKYYFVERRVFISSVLRCSNTEIQTISHSFFIELARQKENTNPTNCNATHILMWLIMREDGRYIQSYVYIDLYKQRSHHQTDQCRDVLPHVVADNLQAPRRVDLHISLQRKVVFRLDESIETQTSWAAMLRMPLPQPTTSYTQQESGTEKLQGRKCSPSLSSSASTTWSRSRSC